MRRLVVIMCVLVLAALIIFPSFSAHRRAKEAMQIEDAHVVQDAIRAYTTDKGSAPKTLNDLVEAGYLKALPGEFPRQLDSDPIPRLHNSN